ncbi:hypothetical protein GCM10007874_62940 [Labrys miyagiensis]|uniref:STAS domain-containing protein n=1 Tax=Labrys miyagiensis TaxID=346912 RepID=A0ABQ6CT16_9HYPH|nr:hypothetical protein GCM10007874_62940 [Labrys miyagiensis]
MQHDDLAGQADARGAAILEGLHPAQGDTDGVGVVAVHLEDLALEMGLDTLDARQSRRGTDALGALTQTFKTVEGLPL